jgi:hypothetical protein
MASSPFFVWGRIVQILMPIYARNKKLTAREKFVLGCTVVWHGSGSANDSKEQSSLTTQWVARKEIAQAIRD